MRSGISSGRARSRPAELGEGGGFGGSVGEGAGAGQGLDAADAAGGGALGEQAEAADVAGAGDVGAAAELERIGVAAGADAAARGGAHRDDADLVAVLLAEERAGAEALGVVRGHDPGVDGGVLADVGVDLGLDAGELVRGHRLGVGEVEAQAVRRDEAAALGDVVAEGAAQGLVQQVGRGVVGADGAAAVVVDGKLGGGAAGEGALGDAALVDEEAGLLADVGDLDAGLVGAQRAGVADLAAGFGVERRLVEDDLHVGADVRALDRVAADDEGERSGPRRSRCRSRGTRSGRGGRRGRARRSRRRPRRSRPRRRGPWPSARPWRTRSRRRRRCGSARGARPGSGRAGSRRCRRGGRRWRRGAARPRAAARARRRGCGGRGRGWRGSGPPRSAGSPRSGPWRG